MKSAALAGLAMLPKRLLIALVQAYRLLLSPWLGSGCRFEPTCSAYALAALEQHGALAGSYLAGRRLLRCHPACAGGHDPVPAMAPGWLVRRSTIDPSAPANADARCPSEITP